MSKNVVAMMGIMVGSCVAATGSAWAQMQPQAAQPQQPEVAEKRTQLLEEINTVQERAGTLQERINAIAQQALERNPDLQKLHADLMDIYQAKLTEYGHPSEAELQEIQLMQQRLQAPGAADMDDGERQRLTQQFNAEVAKLQEAQQKAQNDPAVVTALQSFDQTRTQAIREVDPEAPALQKEFEEIQGKLENLRRELQQVLQAPPQ